MVARAWHRSIQKAAVPCCAGTSLNIFAIQRRYVVGNREDGGRAVPLNRVKPPSASCRRSAYMINSGMDEGGSPSAVIVIIEDLYLPQKECPIHRSALYLTVSSHGTGTRYHLWRQQRPGSMQPMCDASFEAVAVAQLAVCFSASVSYAQLLFRYLS